MLEEDCCLLDAEISCLLGSVDLPEEMISRIKEYLDRKRMIEESISAQEEKIALIQDAIRHELLKDPTDTENIQKTYLPRIEHFQKKKDCKVILFYRQLKKYEQSDWSRGSV